MLEGMILVGIFIFIFGLAIGSFLNCLVFRLNRDGKLPKGRSFCDHCRRKLTWFDNIPLFSFLILRGKCRFCRSPISWLHPIVEVSTGFLSVFVFFVSWQSGYGFGAIFYHLFVFYALLAIFVSDLLYQTIPSEISYPAIGTALVYNLAQSRFSFLIAGLLSAGFFLLLHLVTKKRGMAMGDVILAFLLGLFLGWPETVICFYFAFLSGAIIGAGLLWSKRKKLKEQIPFGPFLTAGALVSFFWGEKIFDFYLKLLGQ